MICNETMQLFSGCSGNKIGCFANKKIKRLRVKQCNFLQKIGRLLRFEKKWLIFFFSFIQVTFSLKSTQVEHPRVQVEGFKKDRQVAFLNEFKETSLYLLFVLRTGNLIIGFEQKLPERQLCRNLRRTFRCIRPEIE